MSKINKNLELEIVISTFHNCLEALEEYIGKTNHYPDWDKKRQIYRRSIEDSNDTEAGFEDLFLMQLTITAASIKRKSNDFCQEIQQELYKWINVTGLTADNCPKRLKHYLLTINEVLENKAQEFIKQMRQQAKEIEEKQNLNNSEERKAINTIFGGIQKKLNHPTERKEIDIKGDAKLGRESFAKIAKSVSITEHQNFNFRAKEKENDDLKKETADKGEKKPKNDSDKDLEKTSQLTSQPNTLKGGE